MRSRLDRMTRAAAALVGLLSLVAVICLIARCAEAGTIAPDSFAAKPAEAASGSTDIEAEQDPTRPVLFSLRDEYRDKQNDVWTNTAILRVDRLVLKNLGNPGGARGLILRADVPLATVHRGTATTTGLSDLYVQAIYIPHINRKFGMATGTGLFIPTASDDVLGRGKWIASPLVGPVWFFAKNGMAYIKLQDYFSFAGASDRADVHYFSVLPTLLHRISGRWWGQVDTEVKEDWITHHANAISGVQIGRMLHDKFGAWIKTEIPWGYYREGDWTVKVVVFHVR
jgi:hypothetical protein